MSDIPIGLIGKIVAGNDAGKLVKVVADLENTGGYLILTSKDKTAASWHDSWVESEKDLEKFFKESRWLIEWGGQEG